MVQINVHCIFGYMDFNSVCCDLLGLLGGSMNEIDKVIETLKKMQEISQREVYKYMIDDLEKAKIELKEWKAEYQKIMDLAASEALLKADAVIEK